MSIKKLCKQLFLFALFWTLVLQLGSATSWFISSAKTEPGALTKTVQTTLPFGFTINQLQRSLAQFTYDGIVTPEDIAAFLDSANRGGIITYQLFFGENRSPLTSRTRREHLRALVDLVSFFYLTTMLTRDDGLMPADVTFGILDPNDRVQQFTQNYLNRVRDHKKLDIGSEKNIFGTNHLAYYRQQSHGFNQAWGLNLYLSKKDPAVPLLFTNRWHDRERLQSVTGPLYHLLMGTDQHLTKKFYIKPEECGIYFWGEWFGHTKGYLKVIGRRTPVINRLLDADDDPPFNKERLPRSVLSHFKNCMRAHGARLGSSEKEAIRRGIAGLYEHALKQGWLEFVEYIDTHYTLPQVRRGNEIIIAPETAIWSAYFITKEVKIRQMFNALAEVKRALMAGKNETIRKSMSEWRLAYGAAKPQIAHENSFITSYLGKLSARFNRLLGMPERQLAAFVGRYRRQIFA